jgi:superfamily II DNA/RNA helicase
MTTSPRAGSGAPSHQRGRRRRRPASATPQPSRPAAPAAAPTVSLTPSPTPVRQVDTFGELDVPQPIVDALAARDVLAPFPIQTATLPDSLAGRDVLGRGRTGSGKTLAFAIPTVARLAASRTRRQSKRPRALVLVPTRELANQVAETLTPLATALDLRVVTIFGGVGQQPQVQALRSGVDVVIACPGRLDDLIAQRHCSLDSVEITVLDEADHMADLGFLPVVRRLLDATPTTGQRLLFSATLDRGVDVLVQRYLTDPVVHSVDPEVAPVSTMTHHVFAVAPADKQAVVHALAGGRERSLLFTRTKHGAKKLAKQLTAAGIPAVELHGNLSQNARERNLESFTEGSTRVLVATDIAARGIHVDEVALVVHVDPPAEHKAYLHRSGRTARAGASGVAVTLMTPDQAGDVRALARAASIEPVVTKVSPGHDAIATLVGEPAERRMPAPVAAAAQQATSRRQGEDRPRSGRPNAGRPSSAGRATARPAGERSDRPDRSDRSQRSERSERSDRAAVSTPANGRRRGHGGGRPRRAG